VQARVGAIEIRNRVLAAPICGASKIPYRLLALRHGADLAYTEMVKAYPLVRRDAKTLDLLARHPDEAPTAPQICGGEEQLMADASRVCEELGFPLVDINMGCPVPKVVREGAGAALLKEPERIERIVRACTRAVSIPVTVKIRSGWDGKHVSAVPVAQAAEAGGAALISIHARTREQRHGGEVDLESIAAVKQAVKVPVIGNGSVTSGERALRMLRETGCDAVMVGRGAFGRPWVFRDIARAVRGEAPLPPPGPDELRSMILWHLERTIEIEGGSEARGNSVFRKFAAWYLRDAPYGTWFRDRVFHAKSAAETRAIVDEFAAGARLRARAHGGRRRPQGAARRGVRR
jgi:nifR3 family TIM-barrel protein